MIKYTDVRFLAKKLHTTAGPQVIIDIGLIMAANSQDIIRMVTPPGTPFFHVILSDRDKWAVEVEWPDFTDHSSATNWVTTQSKTWLDVTDPEDL